MWSTAICTTLAAPMLYASGALAQDQDQNAGQPIEEVIVTGSRIARDPNVVSAVPVQSMDAEQLQLAGTGDVVETLTDLPALMTSVPAANSVFGIFTTGSGEAANADAGEAILQLRGLGVERTLVLVNGRRHVAGVGGSQAVDINSIPKGLIERVEVLTGGASAIYGADAVSGVINFIMKQDFEGLDFDFSGSMPGKGDAESYSARGTWGKNFNDGRGNIAVSVDYDYQDKLRLEDRAFSRNNGIGRAQPNPALRFQVGDIDPTSTPNFARFYSPDNAFASTRPPCDQFGFDFCFGFFDRGFTIPTADEFAGLWQDAFGTDPLNLTPAELALIDRAANAPNQLIAKQPNFSITSPGGILLPGSVYSAGVDLNNNGVDDCQDSFTGYFSTYDFSPPALGFVGGCWYIDNDGTVRTPRDGLIVGGFNQFGPDGIPDNHEEEYITPETERVTANFLGHYQLTDGVRFFTEFKYMHHTAKTFSPQEGFWDLLTISPDNPFIDVLPPELAAVGHEQGFFITRDPSDFGPRGNGVNNVDTNTRQLWRVVAGLDGTLDNGWDWELAFNYGKFTLENFNSHRILVDRWYAAIDVIADPETGEPICRSDIDPTPPPGNPFGIPAWDPGFFTFNPGDGQCVPANLFLGKGSVSPEATAFIYQPVTNHFKLNQLDFTGTLTGDFSDYFTLPAGDVKFATGFEYRDEKSVSLFDPLVRGILPVTTAFGAAGTAVKDIDVPGNQNQKSLTFDSGSEINNTSGSYDVFELFAELSIPVVRDKAWAKDITVDLAGRYSNYSTVGTTWTWNAGGSWTVIDDLRIRGNYSLAVRAPNISELFSPAQGAFFRPADPCEQSRIDALIEAGDPRGPIRQANCIADGIPMGFSDPLSARFVGETVGNPDLKEETAHTFTVGTVIQPHQLRGLTLTVDYYNIRIADAISSVSAQDIVDNCYDSENFPNQFCELFTRNRDPNSPQKGGFTFLRQTELNFASLETAGIDLNAKYQWEIGEYAFDVSVGGTRVFKLDRFFDPGDPSAKDPELGELQRPKWAGNIRGTVSRGPVSLRWQTHFESKQGLAGVEIETIDQEFGPAGLSPRVWVHDISFAWDIRDNIRVYGGINNLTNTIPFLTEVAYPVNPYGRTFFLGLTGHF